MFRINLYMFLELAIGKPAPSLEADYKLIYIEEDTDSEYPPLELKNLYTYFD